jgi:hypothetical protein
LAAFTQDKSKHEIPYRCRHILGLSKVCVVNTPLRKKSGSLLKNVMWDTVGKCVYSATDVIASKDDVFLGLSSVRVCVKMKDCIPLGEVDSIYLRIVFFGAHVVIGSRNVSSLALATCALSGCRSSEDE